MSNVERLVYVALAASVNREGVCLWGTEKLLSLAGCSKEEWDSCLGKLVEWNLVRMPASGDIGIYLVSLESQVSDQKEPANHKGIGSVITRGPFVLKTTTTVELGELNVESKDSK
ncbi:MAG: hypothetical protein ACKOAD_01325 [Gammaproteobacteria bacterium]